MNSKPFLLIAYFFSTIMFSQETIEVLSSLPDVVSETSGLIFHNGKLITHNDSGNTAQLFEIDTVSYEVSRTVTITNAVNVDWEDLTQDSEYIYIGDFGNNNGTRTDLGIYRILKEDYNASDSVTAERISFSYEDQEDFSDNGNSDWDAEAFFILNDRLIVLTKQWQSEGTDAYSIPKAPGEHIARKIDSYNAEGLVTGATYNPVSNALFLIGYSSTLRPFTIRFESLSTNTTVFSDDVLKTNLSIGLGQVESIAYVDENNYFFTSEFFSRITPAITLEATLFRFNTSDATQPGTEPEPESDLDDNEIVIYKVRLNDFLEYESGIQSPIVRRSVFDPLGREIRFVLGDEIESNRIDLSTLQNGIYYLTFFYDDRKKAVPFYKD